MVMCMMEEVSIPKPPALPTSLFNPTTKKTSETQNSTKSQGFRLLDDQGDTGSVYSVYKQKIDAMFESDSSTNTKNSVQARIEKMFTDVALDGGIPINEIGCHNFSVDYLGSVPLNEKVTSLGGLQAPLKELYFAYKRNTKHKKALTGRLEISSGGLKVQYQGEKGDLEQLNSFPTIAVWSAVKFVLHEKNTYAFLPLITDPDNIDKQTLFRCLDQNEKKYITNESHSPLFAVVMRKIGIHKQLECHGFLCQTSEDAIVIAATLYKSLMAHMKAKEKKPKNKNGVTCMSIASSTFAENLGTPVRPPRKKRSTSSSVTSEKDVFDISDSQPLIQDNRNKIQKKTTKRRAPKAPTPPKEDLDAILPFEELDQSAQIKPKILTDKWNTYMSNQQKQITAEIKQMIINDTPNKGLKSVQAPKKRDEESILSKSTENSGDILTKVTIPRSGSFLNAGGLTRYKSKVYRSNGQASGGSPLGFNELFQEFRLQEGLHSMDEILGVIIDPEGMSFNDLKPIYKEFLLKLAVTLTKDELYQRSKSIMRRQKKKQLKRNTLRIKRRHLVVSPKFKRIKHMFRKSLKLGRNNKFGGVVHIGDIRNEIDPKLPESTISTSSYDTRQFRPKELVPNQKKMNYKRRTGDFGKSTNGSRARRDRTSTSEESDFFSLRRTKTKGGTSTVLSATNQNRNSSSGYVSCSECSYDSDTCTCVSADKCYCSLGNKNFNKRVPPSRCMSSCRIEDRCYCTLENNPTWCGCDTDSCTDSNKCYCQYSNVRGGTIFEQLKQRGFIPSPDVLPTPPNHKKLCKKNSNSRSTRSLEYMHNPNEKYYEKLRQRNNLMIMERRGAASVDYELFAFSNNLRNGNSRGIYARAMSDAGNYAKHHHGSIRSYNSTQNYGTRGRTLQSTAIPAESCDDALSVKKSAEIAALFADIKLSQTTDIAHLTSPKKSEMDKFFAGRNSHRNPSPTKTYAKLNKTKSEPPFPGNRFSNNPLYTSKNNQKMYSAQNGLYTIQSQSDESRRSSISENNRQKNDRDYFDLGQDEKIAGSSLENSLGYLP